MQHNIKNKSKIARLASLAEADQSKIANQKSKINLDSQNSKIIKILNKAKKTLSVFNSRRAKTADLENREINKSSSFLKKTPDEQKNLDKKLVHSLSKSKIPNLKQIKYIKKILSAKEVRLLRISFFCLAASLIFLGGKFYLTRLQAVPVQGGGYTEGLIGNLKYINPLYASYSDVDSDISSLIFSSLLKRNKNGQLINDLAIDYQVSEDYKIYTFRVRTDAKWHNNENLTVDDIVFTLNTIKDNRYKSPLRESFIGVKIKKVDESTIKFILREPYAAFLELLTFGIMPQNIWYQIPPASAGLAELNLKPVGSGPYKFKSLVKDKITGQLKSYSLAANNDYYNSPPYITNLTFKFFPNFEEAINALNNGLINGISYMPKNFEADLVAQDSLRLHKLNLPQLTAIFFNQKNNDSLKDKTVRQAMSLAINKPALIETVLAGDARLIDGPILPDSFAYNLDNKKYHYNLEKASQLLDKAGWKTVEITKDDLLKAQKIVEYKEPDASENFEEEKTDTQKQEDEKIKKEAEIKIMMGEGKWRKKNGRFLIIKLTTVETDENFRVVESVKKFWEEAGIKTNLELMPGSQIQTDIIKSRNFEALFYGQVVGADPDLYVFWHSSQIGETGLNLSNYANKEVDKILEDARVISNIEERKNKYKKFQETITDDLPAIFMYSPVYTYVQSKKIKGFDIKNILMPRDRFANITDWYVKTGKKLVW